MRQKLVNAKDGFTLLEAMIAVMILGLVLAAVLATVSQSARYLTDIRRTARAAQVLQQEMEYIRLLDWSTLQSVTNTFTDPSDSAHIYAGKVTQSVYTNSTYGTTNTIVKVTLTVSWTNQVNRVLTNSLTALVGNGGLNKYIF